MLQSGRERRRLLDFVLSNSTWGNGELRVRFRQPFDLIALGTTELKQKKAAGVGSDDLYQFKYSWVDAFRTSLCSNSQKIADFLRRLADLDLAA